MANSFLFSPAVVISGLLTLAVIYYAYIHLPRQMHRAYRQGLLTLARAVETKDTGSVGHGERVAEYVAAVAKTMRVPARERLKVEYASFLQDIGNVRVPHGILNSEDDLTEEEFSTLKSHTVIGAEIVEQVKFLREISPIIRHHHESWDGGGYPDGIKGDEIPLGARIIAVCTAYDAMLHAKAYRPPLTEEDAVRLIRASSGAKYDPSVVDTFLKVLKERQRKERESR